MPKQPLEKPIVPPVASVPGTRDGAQSAPESLAERVARLPRVLDRYAKDVEKHGRPIDSGLPDVLRLAATELATMLEREGRETQKLAAAGVENRELVAALDEARAERDKLRGFYEDVVKELGDDRVVARVRALEHQRDELSSSLKAVDDELEKAREQLAALPADWRTDSSLETWFPLTAAKLAEIEGELDNANQLLAELEPQRAKRTALDVAKMLRAFVDQSTPTPRNLRRTPYVFFTALADWIEGELLGLKLTPPTAETQHQQPEQ